MSHSNPSRQPYVIPRTHDPYLGPTTPFSPGSITSPYLPGSVTPSSDTWHSPSPDPGPLSPVSLLKALDIIGNINQNNCKHNNLLGNEESRDADSNNWKLQLKPFHYASESTHISLCNMCVFLLLFFCKLGDQLSPNFHRFVILCECWDTPSKNTGLWQLPNVSSGFKPLQRPSHQLPWKQFVFVISLPDNVCTWTPIKPSKICPIAPIRH